MNHGRFRRLRTSVAVAFIAATLAACGGAQSRLAAHLERGKQYLAEGNYQKGGVEFRNALQIDPKNVEAQVLAGKVAEQGGDYRAALNSYRAALGVDENSSAARAALARIMLFAGEPAQALELLAPGLVKTPQDPELLTVRAAAKLVQKDPAGARADAELAHELAPENESAIALLAAMYRQDNDPAAAEKLVREAVERNPDSVDLREVLANLYSGNGDEAKLEEQMRAVIKLRPDELARRTRFALYLARAKRLDDAQRVLTDAVRDLPNDDQAKLQLVDFIASQRSREQGEKTLREYIAANKDNDDLRLGLGALLQRSEAPAEALAVYREIIARDGDSPKSFVARNRIAAMQVSKGEFADAQKTIDEVLAKNPRDIDALTLRGNLALERKDAAAAIADLRAVLREQPEALLVRRSLARAHVANGEPALAEDVLREGLRAAPNDPNVRIDLAQLLTQTKRAPQAVTLLEETVRQSPADSQARETLVRAYLGTGDFATARTAAEDLKTLRPDSASGPYLAGLIAQSDKRPDDARREFLRAVELQPSAMDVQAALARLDMSQGRNAEAEQRLRALITKEPKNAIARNLLGELLLAGKSHAAAAEQFSQAVQDEPKWSVPWRNLATAHAMAGDKDGVVKTYEAGIKATDYAPDLAMELASMYEVSGKPDVAITVYEELYRRRPHDEAAANNLAMLLVTYRTDKVSLDRAKQMTGGFEKSESGAYLDTSGWVRLKAGDVNDALALLERAVSRTPDSRVYRFHLAMAQIEAGQHEKARGNLENVLKDEKGFSGREAARAALENLKRRSS